MRNLSIVLLLLMAIVSCDIFVPREAEEPLEPAVWNHFPTQPKDCYDNLKYSYNDPQWRNIHQYGSIFTDDFVFRFAPQDVTDFTLPSMWGKASEVDMLVNAYQRDTHFELTFTDTLSSNVSVNSATFHFQYSLLIHDNPTSLESSLAGEMVLYLVRENGLWKIKEWSDARYPNRVSFGRLKNAFAS